MTTGCLLDANHLGPCPRAVSPLRDRLREAHRRGVRFGTCVPVLCEAEAGLAGNQNPEPAYRTLRGLLRFVKVWPLEPSLARVYGELYFDLRRRGRVLSAVDIMQAALCRQMSVTLLTTDRDFEALPDLRCENWLAVPPVS
jgi:tRNA(fMet)-specific endonuclease VapC